MNFVAFNDPGRAENGIYVLCYCYETATQKCDQLEQFKAGAARFKGWPWGCVDWDFIRSSMVSSYRLMEK